MSIVIKEIFPGSGDNWYNQNIVDRDKWLRENVNDKNVKVWYGGLESDDRFIEFINNEDALAYKIIWMC